MSLATGRGHKLKVTGSAAHFELPIAAVDNGGDSPGLDRLVRAVRLGAVEFMRMPIDRPDAEALMERLSL